MTKLRGSTLQNKWAVIVAAAIVSVSGCSTLPSSQDLPEEGGLKEAATSNWNAVPAVRKVKIRSSTIMGPSPIPKSVGAQLIRIGGVSSSKLTLRDLSVLLGEAGVQAVVRAEDANRPVSVPVSYDGKLGDFLTAIARANDIQVFWDGFVTLAAQARYMLAMPQVDEKRKGSIKEEVEALGGKNVILSVGANTIAYTASPSQHSAIANYVRRSLINAGKIGLQVSLISVSLNDDRSSGIDWGSLFLAGGDVQLFSQSEVTPPGSATGTALTGAAAALTGSGLVLRSTESSFSLSGVLNLLHTYGTTRTLQSVTLETISGNDVGIESGLSIPYVETVGVTPLSSGTTISTDDSTISSSSLFGSVRTARAQSGINVKFRPYYDNYTGEVTVGVDMTLSNIVAFETLSAGAQLGEITQPTMRQEKFNSVVKAGAGDTVLLGGIAFDYVEDTYATLSGLENWPVGGSNRKANRNVLFILMRPVVTYYEVGA